MIDRAQMILLQLANADGPLTSSHIAAAIGVSARTVRSAMPQVASQLEAHGARLVSKRNVGYYLEVSDPQAFEAYQERLAINSLRISVANYDDQARHLYISRKLVASPDGAKLDELCDELCLSRSAIRGPLRRAYEFCESFRLEKDSVPGRGVRVRGKEHLVRLAMAELFEVHFHKAVLDETDREYAQWIDCDWRERQDIRHAYLKIQRESGWSMRDSSTQRVAMYLIIARNRITAGHDIELPEEWVDDIRLTPFYDLADRVFAALATSIDPSYDVSAAERAFLGMFMLCNLDVDLSRDARGAAPFLYDEATVVADRLLEALRRRTTLDFASQPRALELLSQIVLTFLASKRYGLDGCRRFNYENESAYCLSPLCTFVARILGQALVDVARVRVAETDAPHLAAFATWVLAGVGWRVRPLRVIVCDSMGTEYARRRGEMLARAFPDLVASVRPCGLYEVRGFRETDYDVLFYDRMNKSGYNYSYPMGTTTLWSQGMDLARAHDELLVRACDVDGLLPATRHMRVIRDFHVDTPQSFFRLLALRHAPDEARRWQMEQRLVRDDSIYRSGIHSSCVFVFDTAEPRQSCLLELYCLARPMIWNGNKVNRLLYLRLRFDGDILRAKAHERVLALLASDPHSLDQFEADPDGCLRALLGRSLRLCGSDATPVE